MGGGPGGFFQRVERAGADIPVNDAKGAKRRGYRQRAWMAEAIAGVLVTGLPPSRKVLKDIPTDIALVGPSLGRDHQPVCDETPQITMG